MHTFAWRDREHTSHLCLPMRAWPSAHGTQACLGLHPASLAAGPHRSKQRMRQAHPCSNARGESLGSHHAAPCASCPRPHVPTGMARQPFVPGHRRRPHAGLMQRRLGHRAGSQPAPHLRHYGPPPEAGWSPTCSARPHSCGGPSCRGPRNAGRPTARSSQAGSGGRTTRDQEASPFPTRTWWRGVDRSPTRRSPRLRWAHGVCACGAKEVPSPPKYGVRRAAVTACPPRATQTSEGGSLGLWLSPRQLRLQRPGQRRPYLPAARERVEWRG
jgi:hypothetical protein